jgi:VWFA-related protein
MHVKASEVLLDVVVTDRHGNYVTGLKPSDFHILEDGVPQTIRSFQPPSLHALSPDETEVHSSADLARIGNSPVTILVLDETNTPFEDAVYARTSLQYWLKQQPARLSQPATLVSVSDRRFAVLKDYTQDRDALLATLKNYFPTYPYRLAKGGNASADASTRMIQSIGSLIQIAQASSGTIGRKNVIWVGAGFPQFLLDAVPARQADALTAAVKEMVVDLLKARVTLNIIDPTSMATSTLDLNNPEYLSLQTLQDAETPTTSRVSGILNFDTFAPATGGMFASGRNDIARQIGIAAANGANYYTLSYDPTNRSDRAEKFRSISIRMSDPSLTATTRTGYFPRSAQPENTTPAVPPTRQLAFDLVNAALSKLSYNGLKITLSGDATGPELLVGRSGLQPHLLADGRELAEVTLMQVWFDKHGKVLSHTVHELQAPFPSSSAGSSATDIAFRLPSGAAPAGPVRERLVVRDAIGGHIGSLDVPER